MNGVKELVQPGEARMKQFAGDIEEALPTDKAELSVRKADMKRNGFCCCCFVLCMVYSKN